MKNINFPNKEIKAFIVPDWHVTEFFHHYGSSDPSDSRPPAFKWCSCVCLLSFLRQGTEMQCHSTHSSWSGISSGARSCSPLAFPLCLFCYVHIRHILHLKISYTNTHLSVIFTVYCLHCLKWRIPTGN